MNRGVIESITIVDLFGKFSYSIPHRGELQNPSILYGDNGVGKSTILNLVFHLLSPAGDKRHRSNIKKIPFRILSVRLAGGIELRAERNEGLNDPVIVFSIFNNSTLEVKWVRGERTADSNNYSYLELTDVMRRINAIEKSIASVNFINSSLQNFGKAIEISPVRSSAKEYLSLLEKISPRIFYVNADRRLYSDSVADPSEELEIRQAINHKDMRQITDVMQASRNISLKQALANASKWINRRAVIGANQGSVNVHSVYEQIILQLSAGFRKDDVIESDTNNEMLLKDLDWIEKRTSEFSQYELSTSLSMASFKEALLSNSASGRHISSGLIAAYIEGVKSRLEAIDAVYIVLDKFVKKINSFLYGKKLSYSLSTGFSILDDVDNKPLNGSQLSSGEQQLLLMFCYVLTAREVPSVFIIDEPEISLNIKWQRKLISSMLSIAKGSEIQFVFASHSLEIISQHDNCVVKLEV